LVQRISRQVDQERNQRSGSRTAADGGEETDRLEFGLGSDDGVALIAFSPFRPIML